MKKSFWNWFINEWCVRIIIVGFSVFPFSVLHFFTAHKTTNGTHFMVVNIDIVGGSSNDYRQIRFRLCLLAAYEILTNFLSRLFFCSFPAGAIEICKFSLRSSQILCSLPSLVQENVNNFVLSRSMTLRNRIVDFSLRFPALLGDCFQLHLFFRFILASHGERVYSSRNNWKMSCNYNSWKWK